MADDELCARVRQGVVPHAVAGQVVAGGGEAGEERRGGVAVSTDGLIVSVVTDVEGVLAVARHRGRSGTVELASVEAGVDRGVLKVETSDAAVVVVHGNVEHAPAHFHGNWIAVRNVVVGVGRVRRPSTCAVAMRDDTLSELPKAVEVSTAHDQMRAVGPQFVEDVAGVARQSVSCFPRAVPSVGVFVVPFNTVFCCEQRFSVVFDDTSNGEPKVGP